MGSLKLHNVQAKKATTILKYRQLQKIASIFRFVELCVVLVLIFRLSFQLPIVVKNSSEYFRGFSVFMANPCFVFVIGNVIIITLLVQSGQFSAQGSESNSSVPDIYREFIQNSTKNQRIQGDQIKCLEKQRIKTENSIKSQRIDGDQTNYPSLRIDGNQIKYPEKQIMKSIITTEDRMEKKRIEVGQAKCQEKQSMKTGDTTMTLMVKDYRRCQTENLSRVNSERPRPVLRRSETENSRKSIEPAPAWNLARTSYPEDGMSNEEFRRTIEAFIARQQRLRREEQDSVI